MAWFDHIRFGTIMRFFLIVMMVALVLVSVHGATVENDTKLSRKLLQFPGFPGMPFGGSFGIPSNLPNASDPTIGPYNVPNTSDPTTGNHNHTACHHHCVKGLPGPP